MINNNSLQTFWDGFAASYSKNELITFQAGITCFTMTECFKPNACILEVGCATGVGTEIVAKSMLKKGSLLVASDFSKNMVDLMFERFDNSDFGKIPVNQFIKDTCNYVDQCEKQIDLSGLQNKDHRVVLGCQASGSRLPFADSVFDCYVANMVLQLIDDPNKMLSECFRVLKKGGTCCFTVWGRKEETLNFSIVEMAMRKLGRPMPQSSGQPSNFDIGEQLAEVKKTMNRLGFCNLKHWYQYVNFVPMTGREFFENRLGQAMDDELLNEVIRLYDERTGANTSDFRQMEALVIMATKN